MVHQLFKFRQLLYKTWYQNQSASLTKRVVETTKVFTYPFYRRGDYLILACSLDTVALPEIPLSHVTIRFVTTEDIPALQTIAPLGEEDSLPEFYRRGSLGVAAWINQSAAAYCWASFTIDAALHRVQLPLQAGDVFTHNFFTASSFRGMGLAGATTGMLLKQLQQQGYHRVISHVLPDNTAAVALHRKLGYSKLGYLVHRRIFSYDQFKFYVEQDS